MNGSGRDGERGYVRPSTPVSDTRNDSWHVLLQTCVQNPLCVFSSTDEFLLSRSATCRAALLFISSASRVTHSAQSWTGVCHSSTHEPRSLVVSVSST